MVVYYQLPMLGKVGSHYVRQHPGQQDLSARKRGTGGDGMAHWAGNCAYNSMEELEYGLTSRAQQLAMGVLGTMFGGIALLSGGSSKAVQQSPPIKASSRGEEDFIQYVSNTLATCCDAIRQAVWNIGRRANAYAKEIPQGRRGREEALSWMMSCCFDKVVGELKEMDLLYISKRPDDGVGAFWRRVSRHPAGRAHV
jgi:hypothetical protein